ncbi:uncharacterized protein LOC112686856 [Sipha flava]|uniref:Uncharacterized protein LOC112686856 n=1 Tax=Sipha flava TaxID=143950 RepID=A0A2S2R4L4_9HEMI|nr:uncharacterized protein LOC112686856 [Sipha flava]XP_025415097.1 uncharacterized protein LOC112686856 [Sipha flava]
MALNEGIVAQPAAVEEPAVEDLTAAQPLQEEDDILTIEEARKVIKQLKDRCRFQAQQTLMWRNRAKMQEDRQAQMRAEYGSRLESLTSNLMLFEARLTRKQRAIGELLEYRQCIIDQQQHVIRCLHSRLADFGLTVADGPGGCVAGCGPGCDDGNVDDSDSAVIMEEDESGNSQVDTSEQRPPSPSPALLRKHRQQQQQCRDSDEEAVAAVAAVARAADGRGGNVTATTYNRVMSNHRSVTKPKDVKYKRINKAKSKSLEELRGRLKNWVDRGQRMSLTVDPTYG